MSQNFVAKRKSKEDPKHDDNLDFCWGRRTGDVYYDSFSFDGTEYYLGDSVYMTPSDDGEPHIGKLVKIWDTPSDVKMVKLVWFFRPCEIACYLQDVMTLDRELFLACGQGEGVFNTSQLEAIAGKCDIVCSSKDRRNCKPTEEDLKKADYVFYRTFDVGKCIISDEFPSNIGGIEVGHFFNPSKHSKHYVDKPVEISTGRKVTADGQSAKESKGKQLNRKVGVIGEFEVKQLAATVRRTNNTMQDVKSASSFDYGARKKMKLQHSLGPRDYGLPGSQARVKKLTNGEDSDKETEIATVTNKILLHEKSNKSARQHVIQRTSYEFFEVPRRPDTVAGKWLKVQDGLREAHQKGTLVLFDNLDPSFTFAEVEDIVLHVFGEKIQAKMIPPTPYSNQHSGKALTIFKQREGADNVILKLQNERLVVGSGRPIFAWRRALKDANSSREFVGHLAIDRGKAQWHRREIRVAVSTSHFSQPNTVEYDLAMQWRALQENADKWWAVLNEEHAKKINVLSKWMKINYQE